MEKADPELETAIDDEGLSYIAEEEAKFGDELPDISKLEICDDKDQVIEKCTSELIDKSVTEEYKTADGGKNPDSQAQNDHHDAEAPEKFKIRQCPKPSFYLEKTSEIPKHIKTPKYLSKNFFEKVVLTSYPRSGNTLLRKYLEDITGVITGSDCDVRRRLNSVLVEMGMKGEGKVNNSVWTIKSHYPERFGASTFKANKCILLVRNPLDAIISLYNMIATGTHNCSMSDRDFEAFNAYFDMFVSQEIAVWRDFHSYWMDPDPLIPTYVIRYEDLLTNPEETLVDLFRFLLNEKDLEGTLIEALIKKHTAVGVKKEVYKPRIGKVNANITKYKASQLKEVKQLAGQMLNRMGYIKGEVTGSQIDTGFLSDDEYVDASKDYECESLIKYRKLRTVNMRYRYFEFNQRTLDEVCTPEFRELASNPKDLFSIEMNYPGDLIRQRTQRDPHGRGSKTFRDTLRGNVDIILPDGSVKKAIRKTRPQHI